MDSKNTYQAPFKYYKNLYKLEEKPGVKYACTAAKTAGISVLILAILLIMCGWGEMIPFFRILLCFLLLILSGVFSYFVIANKEGQALSEIVAVTIFSIIAALLISLLIFIYSTSGDLKDFHNLYTLLASSGVRILLTLLIALGLLLIYVFDSYFLFACVAVLLLALSSEELTFGFEFFRNALFAGLMLPFLMTKLKNKSFSRAFVQLSAIPYLFFIAITFSGVVQPDNPRLLPFLGLLASILIMFGFIFIFSLNEIRRGASILTTPWCFIGYLSFAIFILSASFSDVPGIGGSVVPLHFLFMVSLVATSFLLAFKNLKEGKMTSFMTDLMISLYQLLIVAIYIGVPLLMPISNMFTLAVICCLVIEGIATKRLFIMNLGLIILPIYLLISSVLFR